MPEPDIHPVESADLPALRELFLNSRRETFTWNDPAGYRLEDFDSQTEGETLLVAEINGQVAGFVALWEPQAFVHHLYVDSKFQGRGIGKLLLNTCLEIARRPATLKCLTRNKRAVKFYQSQGWRIIQTDTDKDGDYHLMELA